MEVNSKVFRGRIVLFMITSATNLANSQPEYNLDFFPWEQSVSHEYPWSGTKPCICKLGNTRKTSKYLSECTTSLRKKIMWMPLQILIIHCLKTGSLRLDICMWSHHEQWKHQRKILENCRWQSLLRATSKTYPESVVKQQPSKHENSLMPPLSYDLCMRSPPKEA